MFICCVPQCDSHTGKSKMHRFPKCLEIYNVWIERVGRMDLNDLDPCRVRESYRICHKHFSKEYCIPGRHGADLTANAIPSLFIPSSVYLNKHNPATSNIQSLSGTVDPDRNESIDQPSKSMTVVSQHVEGSQKRTLQNEEGEMTHKVEELQTNINYSISHDLTSNSDRDTQTQNNYNSPYLQIRKSAFVKRKRFSTAGLSTKASNENNIADFVKKIVHREDQDIFDKFGSLIAFQLRSIPMEDALDLQTDISQLVNKRLLAVHRNKNQTDSLSSSTSQISTVCYDDSVETPMTVIIVKPETFLEGHSDE